MCLSSNIHTHVVSAATEHPLRRYLERGVRVTLNTDGRLMDGITLTDEQYLAHAALGLGAAELKRLTLNACEAAFLPDSEKVPLVARMQSELDALR
jgi:adenosine deaminase